MPIAPSDSFTLPAGTITAPPAADTIGPSQIPATPGAGALPGDRTNREETQTDEHVSSSDVSRAIRLAKWASPLYVRGEDNLRLVVVNALAGVVVTVSARVLTPAGEIIPYGRDLTPTSNRTASTLNLGLMEGWLISADVVVTSGAPIEGQTYAFLQVIRGLTGATARELAFAEDYITTSSSLFWPGGTYRSSLDGRGALRSITATVPGAGAEVSETVPVGASWEFVSLRAVLTTAIAAANRLPALEFDDGALIYGTFPVAAVIPASQAPILSWGPSAANPSALANNVQSAATPVGLRLLAGHRIRTRTTAIQAADQYSAIQYLVRETLET